MPRARAEGRAQPGGSQHPEGRTGGPGRSWLQQAGSGGGAEAGAEVSGSAAGLPRALALGRTLCRAGSGAPLPGPETGPWEGGSPRAQDAFLPLLEDGGIRAQGKQQVVGTDLAFQEHLGVGGGLSRAGVCVARPTAASNRQTSRCILSFICMDALPIVSPWTDTFLGSFPPYISMKPVLKYILGGGGVDWFYP